MAIAKKKPAAKDDLRSITVKIDPRLHARIEAVGASRRWKITPTTIILIEEGLKKMEEEAS